MGKKVINTLLFLLVVVAAIAMTIFVGKDSVSLMIYNFIFLGIMICIYLAGLIGGMFRMNNLAQAFQRATGELGELFTKVNRVASEKLVYLNEIFSEKYLDRQMATFTETVANSQEGIGDIDEFINEGELDLHVHKRLLETVPDIMTSLGILGTFIGLVIGLRSFDPGSYETMTTSVSSLVSGIKVAFLTSIYGVGLSAIYTYSVRSEYSHMTESMNAFLGKFHACVMPTAENESRNIMVSTQKHQADAIKQMAEQFSVQLADSFQQVITPTFVKMNDSLDLMTTTVVRGQKDAIKEILDTFLSEMNASFKMEFSNFNEAIDTMTRAQRENVAFANDLYSNMGAQLNDSLEKQGALLKDMMTEMNLQQNRFMTTSNRILAENEEIQKQQQTDYQHIIDYLKDAERSSAKFWVACNQTMQKYIETAAAAMEKVGDSNTASEELLRDNKAVINEFNQKMQEFMQYQKAAYKTMDAVHALLKDVSMHSTKDLYMEGGRLGTQAISNSAKESIDKLQREMRAQNARQNDMMNELNENLRSLNRNTQKGRSAIFK